MQGPHCPMHTLDLKADRLLCLISQRSFCLTKDCTVLIHHPFCSYHTVSSTRVAPRPLPAHILPLAECLPVLPAYAFHAPSCLAAGASRHPHDPSALVSRLSSLSHTQLLTLGYGAGNARAASAAPVLAMPSPTPTQAYGTHCPPTAAHSAAPSALTCSAASVSRRFRVLRLACIPLSVPTSQLSALSALPACQTD